MLDRFRKTHPEAGREPSGASATFDEANGTVVLFGGDGPYGSLRDTWTWTGDEKMGLLTKGYEAYGKTLEMKPDDANIL